MGLHSIFFVWYYQNVSPTGLAQKRAFVAAKDSEEKSNKICWVLKI